MKMIRRNEPLHTLQDMMKHPLIPYVPKYGFITSKTNDFDLIVPSASSGHIN